MDQSRAFYDELAADYHLIFEDWDASVRRQGEVIHRLLGGARRRVLDVACGMGTQALGLAQFGHSVVARDLSPELVERAVAEARRLGVALEAGAGDMRVPVPSDRAAFDFVIAFDNALPHLEQDADLDAALSAAHDALVPGGSFIASIRDYDAVIETKPRFDTPRRIGSGNGERVVLQLWDWDNDGRGYSFQHILLVRDGSDGWLTRTRRGHYRALLRYELSAAAIRCGFSESKWIEPQASGFYQPIFVARKDPTA